jgi:hypothetical protein
MLHTFQKFNDLLTIFRLKMVQKEISKIWVNPSDVKKKGTYYRILSKDKKYPSMQEN